MKCDQAQQWIVQYIYGELSDERCHSLELHLAGCELCRSELQAYQALRQTLSLAPVEEPSPNFLAQSRVRLDDAIDLLPPAGLWMRLEIGVQGFFAQLHAAPGMAMAVAVVGLGIGASAGHYWKHTLAHRPVAQVADAAEPAETSAVPSVFNVSEIVQHPNTDMVEVHFNTMVPATVEGSIDDPEVQKLLLMATQNAVDPNVQSNSVALLAAQCKAGHFCEDGPVRTALMVALRYDRDPAVRLKALEGLKPYVGKDVRVRDAVLESLMHDPSQPVRSHALQMLEPVQADSSVRLVLQTVSTGDDNPAMREASLKVLQAIPPTE
ncbi:MAG: zf-HC2 domain-containing protein [Acidobacteriaceae bacterium]